MKITFTVPSKPQGKGRPRFSRGHTYTPKKTAEYEALIRRMYQLAGGKMFKGAVHISILMLYPIPKNTPKAKAQQMLSGEILPTKKPDGDNVEKAVADALNGIAYEDDSFIVSASWEKRYVERDKCGLIVTVNEVNGVMKHGKEGKEK